MKGTQKGGRKAGRGGRRKGWELRVQICEGKQQNEATTTMAVRRKSSLKERGCEGGEEGRRRKGRGTIDDELLDVHPLDNHQRE